MQPRNSQICDITKATNLTRNADFYVFLDGDTNLIKEGSLLTTHFKLFTCHTHKRNATEVT